jgi:hypothetical protein
LGQENNNSISIILDGGSIPTKLSKVLSEILKKKENFPLNGDQDFFKPTLNLLYLSNFVLDKL